MQDITEHSVLSLIINASLPVQIVMLILLIISIISWTHIISKYFTIKRAKQRTQVFEELFWSGKDLHEIQSSPITKGPLAHIFNAGLNEYLKAIRIGATTEAAKLDGPHRAMRAAYQREMDYLDKNLSFLSTAGSVSPYIGLLGTVWGIMNSFIGLSSAVQVTLAAVAPGIAEALIATAIGLFAAIPAVVAYNYYTNSIDSLSGRFDTFIDEFINILQRQG